MEFTEGPIQMPDIDFANLEQPPTLNEALLQKIDNNIKSQNWIESHNCITMVRQINKHFPNYLPDLIERYSNAFLDLFAVGKTQIIKNLLRLIQEAFSMGKTVNVQKAVYLYLPLLLKKVSTDIGHIKVMEQEALTSFAENCGYQVSFVVCSEFCCDKSTQISEASIKLLALLIQNIDQSFTQLSPDTLSVIMRALSLLVGGKRQNMKNLGLDICMYIYKLIGSQNYLSLMNYSLSPEEVSSMSNSMQTHRTNSKQRPVPLASVLQQRKSMMPQNQNYNSNNGYCSNNFGMR